MKKITLITIVCLLTPCFGIFGKASASDSSIDGTLWRVKGNGVYVTLDPLNVEAVAVDSSGGFSDGKMYMCQTIEGDTCTPYMESPYTIIDSPVISIVYANITSEYDDQAYFRAVATMLPHLGVGYFTARGRNAGHEPYIIDFQYGYGFMVKVSDDWMP